MSDAIARASETLAPHEALSVGPFAFFSVTSALFPEHVRPKLEIFLARGREFELESVKLHGVQNRDQAFAAKTNWFEKRRAFLQEWPEMAQLLRESLLPPVS